MKMVNGFPRRNRVDLYSPAETAIREALLAVEKAGAHPLLTDAVILLGQAQDKVADFVELCETCGGRQRVLASNPNREKSWEVACPDCTGVGVGQTQVRDGS